MPNRDMADESTRIDSTLLDRRNRPLRDLRISVTDRCNFRCRYCMPIEHFGKDFEFLKRAQILSFEELVRTTRVLTGLGLAKVRITGGEPLLRRDLPELIRQLKGIQGLDVALTTNGSLLGEQARALSEAGLGRVTISLDALDDVTFRRMNGVDVPVDRVLQGLNSAEAAGLRIKINAVIRRGVNEGSILPLAKHFRHTGHTLRFIEYMDVGLTNGWRLDDVVSAKEIVETIGREFPLEPLEPAYPGEVARNFRYRDGGGELGVIASVTQPFCGQCSRLRLSADGQLFTCLFGGHGHDLKTRLRDGSSDSALAEFFRQLWGAREDRYSELRSLRTVHLKRAEMSYLGG